MREDLSKKIDSAHLNPNLLVEKYIPNLIAKLFQVTKEYAQVIHDQRHRSVSTRFSRIGNKILGRPIAAPEACLYHPRRAPCIPVRFSRALV